MTTLTDKYVLTRKEHKCFSYLRKFPKGTKLRYWTGIYEGSFCSSYVCLTCDKIIDKCDDDGEGYPEGLVREMLNKGQTPEELLKEMK